MSRDRDDDRDRGRSSRDREDDRGRDRDRERDDDRPRNRDRDEGRSRDRDDRDSRGSRDRDRDERGGRGDPRAYEYRARSVEDAQERSEMGNQDYDKLLKPGTKIYKVRDGDNRIRVLPPTWPDAKHYGLDVWVHYSVGPDRQSYLCPRKHGKGECPICDERDSVRRDSAADDKYVKDLEPKRRVLVYLIDRDEERAGEQTWFMPQSLDKDITKVSIDKDTRAVLPIDHPEDGYDIIFDKSGSKLNTKYSGVQISRRSSPLGKRAWLENAMDNPLPDQLKVFDGEHIAKVFGAGGIQRDRDDDRGGRDRDRDDDRRGGRDRDRDDDRPRGRGREDDDERYRGDFDRNSRGRDRDEDRGRGRDREQSRERDDEPTWKSVHKMTRTELEDLIELKRLPIKPRDAKDDDDLADWVCEELKLKEEVVEGGGRSRRSMDDEPPARERDRDDDRLREMRRRREE
jgi:hypothetical protein